MFGKKYNISLIDSKWNYIKSNVNFHVVPRISEYIYFEDKYYQVLNVVHKLEKKQEIFVVLSEMSHKYNEI
jgi:hypothetical protein